MKKGFLVLFAAVMLFSCNEKKETTSKVNDWMVDNFKGDVQKVVESPYKVDSTGKIGDQDSCCMNTMEYDSAGNILKVTSKDSKGNITNEQTFTKYPNGLFKEISSTSKGKVTSRITIDVDKDGKYVGAQNYDSTGKLASYYKDIVQNDYLQLTAMKQYKPDSTLKSSEENTYDKALWSSGTSKDSSGKVTFKGSLKRDDKLNVTEYTTATTTTDSTHKDSTSTKVIKYKYDSFDEKGNWTQRTELDEKGKATKVTKREITYFKK